MKRQSEPLPPEVQQLLAPFFPSYNLSRVRIYEGIPRYVTRIGSAGPIGYTDRDRIYFAPGHYRLDTAEGLALIAHEIAHCWQYHRLGTWRFRVAYLAAYAKNRKRGMTAQDAYLNIPFEIEARNIEAKVYGLILSFNPARGSSAT